MLIRTAVGRLVVDGFPAVNCWIAHTRHARGLGLRALVPFVQFGGSGIERLSVLGEERDGGGVDHARPAVASFCGGSAEVRGRKGSRKIAALGTGGTDDDFLGAASRFGNLSERGGGTPGCADIGSRGSQDRSGDTVRVSGARVAGFEFSALVS
jgi:hypothetical protein